MQDIEKNINDFLQEFEEIKIQLEEANHTIEAIREGSIDALVLNKNGETSVYSLESADYTYRMLIERFSEGALSISETGLILFCNDAFASMIGSTPDKIIGTYFHSMVDSVGQFQSLKKGLKNGISKGEIMLNIGGQKLPIHISITDLNPQIPAIGIIVTDLSEKRKHEDDLAQYQRRLETKLTELNETNAQLIQFVHVISHDLREPVRKIMAYSSRLTDIKSEQLQSAELNQLKIIHSSASRLNSLVEDLTRYSLNTSKPEMTEVDLNTIIKEVVEDLEVNMNESKAVIERENLPVIVASDFQVRQLFMNLLNNAIKFRKPGMVPRIKVCSEVCDCVDMFNPNKKFYKISICDNGIGIEKAHLNKIFNIFQRLHAKDEYEGNGVGLAICKKIMENHQGKIEAESPLHGGCIFHVYFPIKRNF
ncbi:MAG TPA: ATP-binding protein [Cytophagaceae bacterium]|nr:ATP-binding protein [Cytophagaceae bacterium]